MRLAQFLGVAHREEMSDGTPGAPQAVAEFIEGKDQSVVGEAAAVEDLLFQGPAFAEKLVDGGNDVLGFYFGVVDDDFTGAQQRIGFRQQGSLGRLGSELS